MTTVLIPLVAANNTLVGGVRHVVRWRPSWANISTLARLRDSYSAYRRMHTWLSKSTYGAPLRRDLFLCRPLDTQVERIRPHFLRKKSAISTGNPPNSDATSFPCAGPLHERTSGAHGCRYLHYSNSHTVYQLRYGTREARNSQKSQ